MSFSTHFSKVFALLSLLFLLLGLNTLHLQAAEFVSNNKENLVINGGSNVYAAGSRIEIRGSVQKDLTVAGGTLSVQSSVERNLLAAAGEIKMAGKVGANARLAAGEIDLNGVEIGEDLLIAAGKVSIRNATINGDLVVTTGELILENSSIKGNFYGSYSQIQGGDLDAQVTGKIEQRRMEADENRKQQEKNIFNIVFWPGEWSVIICLALLTFWLNRKKRLHLPQVGFNSQFAGDLIIGLAMLILPIFVFLISLFIFLFPVITTLLGILYLSLYLSLIFLPIYLASLLANTAKIKLDLHYLVALCYAGLLLLNILTQIMPVLGIFNLLVFVFLIANWGFLARETLRLFKNHFLESTQISLPQTLAENNQNI